MQYMGGKHRIRKEIAPIIIKAGKDCHTYFEPFVGGANVFAEVAPHFKTSVASDFVPDLIMLWEEASKGWIPPLEIDEDQYQVLRHSEPSALRAFAGYGCSFGGKWFGGYARNNSGTNYCAQASRGVVRKGLGMRGSKFYCGSYDKFKPRAGIVVYCDPPYAGTTGYNAADKWDADKFWSTMRQWIKAEAVVLVSEYSAPDDWVPVWSKPCKVSLAKDGAHKSTVESLYMHVSAARSVVN